MLWGGAIPRAQAKKEEAEQPRKTMFCEISGCLKKVQDIELPLQTKVVSKAREQLGKPYVYGAEGPNSFDCSGLIAYCYREMGVPITRSSYSQAGIGRPVAIEEIQAGDIIGFRRWGHVGMYIGGGEFIHAPQSGDVVKVVPLASRRDVCGVVRVF